LVSTSSIGAVTRRVKPERGLREQIETVALGFWRFEAERVPS